MALFRVDFSGRGELSERQQKVCFLLAVVRHVLTPYFPQLAQVRSALPIIAKTLTVCLQMLSKLTKLSEEFNICILITNQVQCAFRVEWTLYRSITPRSQRILAPQ